MKNKVGLAFVLLIIVVFCSACGYRIKHQNAPGELIVCFGDSITLGYGAERQEAYPVILEKILKVPVINAGIDSDTTTEALKRVGSDVLGRNPRLVVIEMGNNDFLRRVPLEITLNNMRAIVDRIQEKKIMVAIMDISLGIVLDEYKTEYYKIAKEKGAIFIPSVMGEIITTPSLKSDTIHPNAKGYRMIAEKTAQVLRPYLKARK